jgi:hypothetical protein
MGYDNIKLDTWIPVSEKHSDFMFRAEAYRAFYPEGGNNMFHRDVNTHLTDTWYYNTKDLNKFLTFLFKGKIYYLMISKASGSNSETRRRFCDGSDSNIVLLVPLLPFMAELLQGNTWTGWVIRCIPWSRRYFRTTMQFSKTTTLTFTQLELFSHGMKTTEANFNIFPDQHNHQIWTSLDYSGQFWRLEWGSDSQLQRL